MNYEPLKQELYDFYLHGDAERAKSFAEVCFAKMDARFVPDMSVTAQKCLQYDVICEEFTPVLFPHCPFFYETGVLTSLSDGAYVAKGHGFYQANGWVYQRNEHLFREQDPDLYQLAKAQKKAKLYLICGPYNDTAQHFNFNLRPFLEKGARGICRDAQEQLSRAKTAEETEFLQAVCHGMQALGKMANKFADQADAQLQTETDVDCRRNLTAISRTARRIPWEAPTTFYEALATVAFLRTAMGSLEGVGPNTFGRLDKDLISFYRADLQSGRITREEAYGLISQFLLLWDCHYDHDMIMAGYADHELENTYTVGGCDDEGAPLYNEVTRMLLEATEEYGIIFPKIKCRFSANSPKEYLDLVNRSITRGTSTVLWQNDDATIPALVRAGRPLREARDYMVAGCWDVVTNQEKADHGSYLNLIKPFEFSLHGLRDKMETVGIAFEKFDDCRSFEELYQRTLRNCELVLDAKLDVSRRGGQILQKVNVCPIFSSTLEDCIQNRADYTAGGAKYYDDYQLLFGLPNIVDSLMAIKTLVYDKKKYTLSQFLDAVRANWEGYEILRIEATKCHGWGDGNEDSCALASRLNNDLYAIFQRKTGTYGGKVHMGHLTYTEIRWWGAETLATPDGRRSGEYFAQGLTPSRLKQIPSVTDVVNSLSHIDPSTLAANSVINVILPPNTPLDACEAFLRACAGTAVQSLQLNCTSREMLLDAQKHPEQYPNLIVRVTGFSAKFTSLSKEWQDEVITRNFYH